MNGLLTSGPFYAMRRGLYQVILADPPWHFETRSPLGQGSRSAVAKYATMPVDDICALPVADLCAPDCFLFLWITGTHLPHFERVMTAWGFAYSGQGFTWAKTTRHGRWLKGLGYGTRANPEYCLLGRRGSPVRLDKGVNELIVAPGREHSRKPYESHKRIERFCAGPRLELFARQSRPGWHRWGLEAPPGRNSFRPFLGLASRPASSP